MKFSCLTTTPLSSLSSSYVLMFVGKSICILPIFLNLRIGNVPDSLYFLRMSLAVVSFIFNFFMEPAMLSPY